ncbi:unnamed protein product [Amaranthus hypochondriacus]
MLLLTLIRFTHAIAIARSWAVQTKFLDPLQTNRIPAGNSFSLQGHCESKLLNIYILFSPNTPAYITFETKFKQKGRYTCVFRWSVERYGYLSKSKNDIITAAARAHAADVVSSAMVFCLYMTASPILLNLLLCIRLTPSC